MEDFSTKPMTPLEGAAGMPGESRMKDYLRAFWAFDPAAVRLGIALNLAAAITEGAGLLMLLPLLSLAGVLGPGGAPQLSWLGRVFASLGIAWSLEAALIAFVVLVYIQSQLALHRDRIGNALQLHFTGHLRKTLYAAIARAKWRFLAGSHSAELLNTLTVEMQRIGSGTYFLLRLFTVAVMTTVYLSVAFWLSFRLTLLALATGCLLWWLLRGADDVAKQGGMMLSQANRGFFAQIQEFLSSMKLIKIHGEEGGNLHRFNRGVDQLSQYSIEFQRVRTRVQAVYRVGGAIALALLSYAALAWFSLPAAHLLVLVAVFARLLPQLSEIQGGRQQLLHMLPAFSEWHRLMALCQANRDEMASSSGPVTLTDGISIENAVFSHPESRHVLGIEKLFIPARKTTAIVGVSGSGKTTLLDLLSGLLAPDTGKILVDGVPLPPGWRKTIAYIPQESQIQNGTLRDNLSWGNLDPSDEEIDIALSRAALLEFVKRLPEGLETEVGERGVKLSGGEKQRLALARALLRRPQLLILDEATSALDAGNQRLVIDSIRALHGSMTVLIVTHRSDELAGLIDGIVPIERGQVGAWQPVLGR